MGAGSGAVVWPTPKLLLFLLLIELMGLISTAVSDTVVGRKATEAVVLFLLLGGVSKRTLLWEPASRGRGGAVGDDSIVFSSAAPVYSPEEVSLGGGGGGGGARGLARGVVTKMRGKAGEVDSLTRRSHCSSSSSSSAIV